MTDAAIQSFIDRWSPSGGAERANYALFLSELCDALDVPHPDPTRPEDDDNAYVFERRVIFINPDGTHSFGRIDLRLIGDEVSTAHHCNPTMSQCTFISHAGVRHCLPAALTPISWLTSFFAPLACSNMVTCI
jgi:hypothetical protein